ncbi:MAG TPA: hypothetical protein VK622_17210, partial [Puia sp.]|nr:hypothetical protein [Puia sp.]
RNAWKYGDRDKRLEKIQQLEYDYLAPDSVQELASAIEKLELIAARSWLKHGANDSFRKENESQRSNSTSSDDALRTMGKTLLENKDEAFTSISFFAEEFENSSRKVRVIKLVKGYSIFRELIIHYAIEQIMLHTTNGQFNGLSDFQQSLPENKIPESWINAGGQLIKKSSFEKLLSDIRQNQVNSWGEIHQFYQHEAGHYSIDKLQHALDILYQVHGILIKNLSAVAFKELLLQSTRTAEWITQGIFSSRKKDYINPFRKMVYESQAEMDQVLGKLDDNGFIINQEKMFKEYQLRIHDLIQKWNLN